jgi:hypothetical protein
MHIRSGSSLSAAQVPLSYATHGPGVARRNLQPSCPFSVLESVILHYLPLECGCSGTRAARACTQPPRASLVAPTQKIAPGPRVSDGKSPWGPVVVASVMCEHHSTSRACPLWCAIASMLGMSSPPVTCGWEALHMWQSFPIGREPLTQAWQYSSIQRQGRGL